MLELICQIAIPIFSGTGVYFVAKTDPSKRWGYVFGLCAQPFWFYTLFHNRQWGLFVLSMFFTAQWIKGIYNYWIKEDPLYPPPNENLIKPHKHTFCPYCGENIGATKL